MLRISVRTLQAWRVSGQGPAFLKIGAAVRYERGGLDAWLATRAVTSTSAVTVAAFGGSVR